MSFFDDSHVTDVGLEGSAGPSVSFFQNVAQGFRQQYRVDSARALDEELRNRWLESLRAANISVGPTIDPLDPRSYREFAQYVSGQTVDTGWSGALLGNADPTAGIAEMIGANEDIKARNDPKIKSFEQILEEVSQMQYGVEEQTASMYERGGTGTWFASLLGAIPGSFTLRDPVNIITAPLGAGRTVAMRIATDMGLAALTTGYTELTQVAPAREIVGLPERNPLFNIAAATVGAGLIRGGLIEPAGAYLKHLKGATADINFDLRDAQLAQMFEANIERPSARAGLMALDDMSFVERNNPYGGGQAAQARFMAELQQVQRAMNGEPMTAVARVLPPMPFEQLEKVADFEIVREQAPDVYARMEAAQAKVASFVEPTEPVKLDEFMVQGNERFLTYTAADGKTADIHLIIGEKGKTEIAVNANMKEESNQFGVTEVRRVSEALKEKYPEITEFFGERETGAGVGRTQIVTARRAANKEYEAAYRAVEAEAARIREKQAAVEAMQRRESASILLPTAEGRPFIGPLLQHDYVESLVDRINKFNDTLDERALAIIQRDMLEATGKGPVTTEEAAAIAARALREAQGIDIGLKDPVDPNFNFITDEGEMTVEAAMRDLQDDTDLDEAMRTCML